MRPLRPLTTIAALGCALALNVGCQHADRAVAKLAPDVDLVVGEVATRGVLVLDAIEIGDRDIQLAIQRRLVGSLGEDAATIGIGVDDGDVVLDGQTDNLLARDTAVRVASTTRGVRSIADRITVDVPKVADDELERHIDWALIDEPATSSFDVDVSAKDGAVVLTGQVGSPQERQMAARAARSVHGVRSVDNRLTFAPVERDDTDIQRDVERSLDVDVTVDADRIEVEVADAKVVLHGSVGSVAERHRARELAWVPGVERVFADQLDIVWWRRDIMSRPLVARPDDEAKRDVEQALALQSTVPRGAIEVDVDHGIVVLSGVVTSWSEKQAALEATRRTRFSGAIRDDIRVEPTATIADRLLEERIRRRLDSHALLHDAAVDVEVVGGEAELVGEVPSMTARRAAARIAGDVEGVTEVSNLLSLDDNTMGPRQDAALAEDVSLALSLDPWVDADHVTVLAEGRNVTLTGSVDGPLALLRAMTTAEQAGAVTVIPRLEVGS